jgi:hypothetical protein
MLGERLDIVEVTGGGLAGGRGTVAPEHRVATVGRARIGAAADHPEQSVWPARGAVRVRGR